MLQAVKPSRSVVYSQFRALYGYFDCDRGEATLGLVWGHF